MSYEDLSAEERITAVHIDLMRDAEFSRIGGVTQIGKVTISDTLPTAGTNGVDVIYGRSFVMRLSHKQMRYVVAHEQFHKMLHHCIGHQEIVKKYPQESNKAMDYVVNLLVEQLDGGRGFVERPVDPAPLIDKKYTDWSWLEVLADLLREKEENPEKNKGGQGTLDEHEQQEETQVDPELGKMLADAVAQGEMTSRRIRGEGPGGRSLTDAAVARKTDWRGALRAFIQATCEGDDLSRWVPPNRRMMPLGILLPSHYTETVGELILAADTSGSMLHLYPVLFGEIGRLLVHAQPAAVRVLWWSDGIEGEQLFGPKDYTSIASKLKPRGCGGTRVSCVAEHIETKKLTAKACIYLTDGMVNAQYTLPKLPILWGVLNNPRFQPRAGKVLHISSVVDLK